MDLRRRGSFPRYYSIHFLFQHIALHIILLKKEEDREREEICPGSWYRVWTDQCAVRIAYEGSPRKEPRVRVGSIGERPEEYGRAADLEDLLHV
jgi:hypothetical protein